MRKSNFSAVISLATVTAAVLCFSATFTLAFHTVPLHPAPTYRLRTTSAPLTSLCAASGSTGKSKSKPVNWKRAKHCAEHFGSCDVNEVEELYNAAHKERIQHNLFGGGDLLHDTAEDVEHRVIEEELEVQLHLLQKEHEVAEQEVKLFPDEMTTELPHLHEHADAEHKVPVAERILHRAEHQLVMQETSMGEDTLETLAMCAVVMGMVLLPQLLK